MSYFEETRLREVCQELVRILRAPKGRAHLDYLPPLPQEGARRVVVGVQGRARVLLDLDLGAGQCRVYRQVGSVPFSLEEGYQLGRSGGVEENGTEAADGEQYDSGQAFAEALIRQLEEEYRAI